MYLVISPFFYYIAHEQYIDDYITLESNGENPHVMDRKKLKAYVEKYINLNSHGVDEYKKDRYISYICDNISGE